MSFILGREPDNLEIECSYILPHPMLLQISNDLLRLIPNALIRKISKGDTSFLSLKISCIKLFNESPPTSRFKFAYNDVQK